MARDSASVCSVIYHPFRDVHLEVTGRGVPRFGAGLLFRIGLTDPAFVQFARAHMRKARETIRRPHPTPASLWAEPS